MTLNDLSARLVKKVLIYTVIFGMGVLMAHGNSVKCEVDRQETYVKI